MSTITLPNIRVSSDLTVKVRLKDSGVAIDWSTLNNVKASIYSDAQRALAGRCDVSIDAEDPTLLVCQYAANKPQYVGVNRIVVSAKYHGETKTYDKPAFSFVRWTGDQAGEQITIDDPDVGVEISVEDISSSLLQEAVDAAFEAADRANDAAAAAEHMVDIHTGPEGKSAYEVAVEEGYTGTEEEWLASLVGPQGAQGIQGETGEAAGFGTVSVSLQEDGGQPSATVAASGTDTAKNFAFTFNNLKGEKGDKGDQGNSGYTGAAGELEVVNNLTDGGATKALSAEMGKTLEGEVSQLEAEVTDLETAIDLQEETRTVTKTLVLGTDFTESVGYAPASTGAIVTWNSNFHHSSDIPLPAGGILQVRASGPNTIAVIAKKVTGTTNYEPVTLGTQNASMRDYSYTATEDCEVVVSWQVSNSMYLDYIKKTATETVTTSAINDLQADMSALQTSQTALESAVNTVKVEVEGNVTDDLTSDLVAGKYISHAGTLVTNASFSYKEFVIRAGAVITLDAAIHQNVAAIARKILNEDTTLGEYGFIELVPATSINPSTFTYTATENMTIAVCFNNTADRSISIVTNEVGANTANINDIINGQETYKKSRMLWDIDFGVMFDKIAVIGDSLASGRVEGIVGQPDAAGQDFYNYSWLAHLAKRWRCSAFKNYSNAGADTESWLTDWLPVMQADSVVYDAYFIALGTNNEYNESNPDGDQTNYEAFIQRYNDILDAVRTKAPHAAIFIMSLYEHRSGVGNETLKDIAETRVLTDNGVFYVDYVNGANYFRYSTEVNWRGHFSTTGYVYVSSVINQLVNGIVWDNKTEEFWIQFAKYHNGS